MPATILDKELVVWRDRRGDSHAWPNRCVHRGMRLSLGFVDGERLACRYHGWRYGAGGRCVHVPAHPELEPPETFCFTPYASAERYGLIWASTDAARDAAPRLPALDAAATPIHFCRSLAVDAAPGWIVDMACRALFPPLGLQSIGADRRRTPTDQVKTGDGGGYRCSWSTDTGDMRVDYTPKVLASGVVTVDADFEAGRESLILAVQPVTANHAQVHIGVAAAIPDGEAASLRRHYAAWCRRWRWFLENDDAETTSWRALAG